MVGLNVLWHDLMTPTTVTEQWRTKLSYQLQSASSLPLIWARGIHTQMVGNGKHKLEVFVWGKPSLAWSLGHTSPTWTTSSKKWPEELTQRRKFIQPHKVQWPLLHKANTVKLTILFRYSATLCWHLKVEHVYHYYDWRKWNACLHYPTTTQYIRQHGCRQHELECTICKDFSCSTCSSLFRACLTACASKGSCQHPMQWAPSQGLPILQLMTRLVGMATLQGLTGEFTTLPIPLSKGLLMISWWGFLLHNYKGELWWFFTLLYTGQ